jgi:molecular chaperone DnaK (HSP70)
MVQPKFSIGIDLGTSNSVLAFSPLSGDGGSDVLAIPQWDTPSTVTESATVPSFLYLPEEAIAAQIRGRGPGSGDWVVGSLAQRKASETPGRVAQSAKSWLCHHAADRSAPFLPWGSDVLAQQDKISPVDASALTLAHLRAAWNARFAGQGSDFEFDAQDITITVPASFDAAAQRLTLAAAQQAGFPDHVRLLEEPQAAFYWWLEQQAGRNDPWRALPDPQTAARHVLVIDVGGGTSDFSLFELSRHEGSRDPGIKRVAVSDHILLGGDNILLVAGFLFGQIGKVG